MIQTLRELLMIALASKLQLQGFSEEIFIVRELVYANPTLLTPIPPKIKALKISYYAPHCTNEYAKEKEEKEKTTIFTKYHRDRVTNDYE